MITGGMPAKMSVLGLKKDTYIEFWEFYRQNGTNSNTLIKHV